MDKADAKALAAMAHAGADPVRRGASKLVPFVGPSSQAQH